MLGAMIDKTNQSRREEYADATKAALLDAAQHVFVEEGFQQASIEVIVRRARVTRGHSSNRLSSHSRRMQRSVWFNVFRRSATRSPK